MSPFTVLGFIVTEFVEIKREYTFGCYLSSREPYRSDIVPVSGKILKTRSNIVSKGPNKKPGSTGEVKFRSLDMKSDILLLFSLPFPE